MKNKALLEVNSLHISAGEKEILHGVDLTVGRDETHVLMGPNGTGKSTLGYAVTGDVLGYAGLLVAADEGYITNVAVDPSRRRQGVAAQLLQVFDDFARGNRLAFLTLEVRPSNAAAIALYEGFGFREVGRRRNYYDLPKEDALILTKYYTEEAAQ